MDDKLTTQETLIANFLILLVQTLNYNDKSLSESLIDYNLMMRVSFQKDQVNWGNWKEKRFDKFDVVVISSFSLKNKFWRNLKWQKGEIPVKYQLEISSQFSISEEICDSQSCCFSLMSTFSGGGQSQSGDTRATYSVTLQ